MNALRRHQLVWLSDRGWSRAFAQVNDDPSRACVAHWAQHRLPLVVTRQPADARSGKSVFNAGLPAPACFGKQRIALQVAMANVAYFDEFPRAEKVAPLLYKLKRPSWRLLCAGLDQTGATARVYGSYGWQMLTGLDHLRQGSDLDLLIYVAGADQADRVVALLSAHDLRRPRPRLDGEIMFGNGASAAWREWASWRAGQVSSVLVKQTRGVSILSQAFWRSEADFPCT